MRTERQAKIITPLMCLSECCKLLHYCGFVVSLNPQLCSQDISRQTQLPLKKNAIFCVIIANKIWKT